MKALQDVIRRNRAGEAVALTAVCSAHPDVLTASLLLARDEGKTLLVEATSNQVNQFGGYTGMQPADFIAFVHGFCDRLGVNRGQIHFGGDHLGPQAWRREDSATAMAKARDMMAAYVRAGFSKIHLDCSEGCRGEPAQVGDLLAAERAAELADICERSAANPSDISYIIGTEVPPPGGARGEDDHQSLVVTTPERASATIACHAAAFRKRRLDQAFARVAGLVVQPGVEFGPDHIDVLDPAAPDDLSRALDAHPAMAFEAHSTDYQPDAVFHALARRHFAILKVGPALTFAYRRALYALDELVRLYRSDASSTPLPTVMENLMLARPDHWKTHYAGADDTTIRILRHYAYADRIRYYWNLPEAVAAVAALERSFAGLSPAEPALLQYFPHAVVDRAETLRASGYPLGKSLILAEIQSALAPYLSVAPQAGHPEPEQKLRA